MKSFLSLYIHIPFCEYKCEYCSFYVIPEKTQDSRIHGIHYLKEQYLKALYQDISHKAGSCSDRLIHTIYIGGGTPASLGVSALLHLIRYLLDSFDCSQLQEITIELNPNPLDQIEELLSGVAGLPTSAIMRLSVGIQSFNQSFLNASSRKYTVGDITSLLDLLLEYQTDQISYNADFMVFGDDTDRDQYWNHLLESQIFDTLSLYTLELSAGSARWHQKDMKARIRDSDDCMSHEREHTLSLLAHHGYHRYEISNFGLSGKQSSHNMVYRIMGDYLGFGASAHSFLADHQLFYALYPEQNLAIHPDTRGIRFAHTQSLHRYLKGSYVDQKKTQILTHQDYLIEAFFLALRTQKGIADINPYRSILVGHIDRLIQQYHTDGFLVSSGDSVQLTSLGMNTYNTLIVSMLQEI